ncbi:fumarylacetoacetase [Telmatospirillum sp. J64-1]|uniref:fumarylacetoacetase n=1 Tax=Telmatospirillum sp. J64-1 TaxID=2502183 RepID=UPI00115DFBEF|nr:fumarylacetoacetase [Telmatospirillum sp. J64-1]
MTPNDPRLTSFIDVSPDCHFPIQNLPFGIFSTAADPAPRVGIAIGGQVLDLAVLAEAGLVKTAPEGIFARPSLNPFIALGRPAWRETRARISELLRHDNPALRDDLSLRSRALVPQAQARMHLPVEIGGYTDFYSSREHATNVGSMFRDPKNALMPNWLHIPIGYNGRASSVVVSGTPVRRPNGQTKAPDAEFPSFGPSRKLDFELETAFILGRGNELGRPIPMAEAEEHIFGMVVMNDWSARDIQQWEYVPLGPFNSKTFATSISPWVVTMEALEPFRVAGPVQDPQPLPYLRQTGPQGFDLHLEVALRPAGAKSETVISRTNFRHMYWSMAQQLVHHTISGCNTRIGDLMGSGTISGPTPDSLGSLLELTWNGKTPLVLEGGEERSFLQDGDEVIMTGWCQGEGYRIGFGKVSGRIEPAL